MNLLTQPIPFTITQELVDILKSYSVDPQDYKPAYGGESAGLDLYNVGPDIQIPSNLGGSNISDDDIWKTFIPTGVKIALPRNSVALLQERGSITKTPFILRAGVIDPGYTGEIFVNMVNISPTHMLIKSGDKLPVQLVVTPFFSGFELINGETYSQMTQSAYRNNASLGSSD